MTLLYLHTSLFHPSSHILPPDQCDWPPLAGGHPSAPPSTPNLVPMLSPSLLLLSRTSEDPLLLPKPRDGHLRSPHSGDGDSYRPFPTFY